MVNDRHKDLLWKIVSSELFGFPAKSLACVAYRAGGGFAGAPETLVLAPVANVQSDEPLEVAEFPQPGPSVVYHVGGRSFTMQHCRKPGEWPRVDSLVW